MSRAPEFKFADTGQWQNLQQWLRGQLRDKLPGGAVYVRLGRENRRQIQNDKLWPTLRDISRQCDWPRGTGRMWSEEDWKVIFLSALSREVKVVPGLSGEFVSIGLSSSTLPVSEFADLITFIQIKGDEWAVKWSDPALKLFDEYREAQEASA